MQWLYISLVAATCYALYNLFIKISAGSIHQIAGAVILQIVAAVVGSVILIYLKLTGTQLATSSRGIAYAVLAGVAVGLAEIFSFYLYSKGVNASVGVPVIIGGTVFIGSVLGLIFLKESYRPIDFLALTLIVCGIVILVFRQK